MFSRHSSQFTDVTSTLPSKGAMVTMTNDTYLETRTGWLPASQIKPGDAVATLDGGFADVSWVGRVKPSDDLFFVPAGVLENCSPLILPGDTRVGIQAPLNFDATSDHISLPLAAFAGTAGICKTKRASVSMRTFGFETEEMIWAQTGSLLHARPMSDAFFHSLRFAEARAFLALYGPTHNAVAA